MKTFTAEFDGLYPVGAVALVVAEDIHMALILLNKKLESDGLNPVKITDLKEQDNSTRRVDILLNGDY